MLSRRRGIGVQGVPVEREDGGVAEVDRRQVGEVGVVDAELFQQRHCPRRSPRRTTWSCRGLNLSLSGSGQRGN